RFAAIAVPQALPFGRADIGAGRIDEAVAPGLKQLLLRLLGGLGEIGGLYRTRPLALCGAEILELEGEDRDLDGRGSHGGVSRPAAEDQPDKAEAAGVNHGGLRQGFKSGAE